MFEIIVYGVICVKIREGHEISLQSEYLSNSQNEVFDSSLNYKLNLCYLNKPSQYHIFHIGK